jgi:hypothetical protein
MEKDNESLKASADFIMGFCNMLKQSEDRVVITEVLKRLKE